MEAFCEHGNEAYGSIECWEKLRTWRIMEKDCASWSEPG
jgi:hypothetical protein